MAALAIRFLKTVPQESASHFSPASFLDFVVGRQPTHTFQKGLKLLFPGSLKYD
jgi:hypothetical protein